MKNVTETENQLLYKTASVFISTVHKKEVAGTSEPTPCSKSNLIKESSIDQIKLIEITIMNFDFNKTLSHLGKPEE